MPQVSINYVAVLIAAVANMALGYFWYGPLFGKPWMKLMGFTEKSMEDMKKGMEKTYVLSFIGALVMAFVLAYVVKFVFSMTILGGMKTGFGVWLGFVAPVQMAEVLWGGKSWELYKLNTGYQLVSLMVMGAILAVMG